MPRACCRRSSARWACPRPNSASHIAWDIGAEKVARLLSRLIDAPLLLQRYSRLAYDCNRPPESPDAIPEVSELTAIPGNRKLSADRQAGARARDLPALP